MSAFPDKPWTEEEKSFLLTEILKKAGISWTDFFNIVKEQNIDPSWMEIPLPSGRSLSSCQDAFHRMGQDYASLYSRRSLPAPVAPQQVPPALKKRALFPLEKSASLPRAIQPKLPEVSGRFPGTEIAAPTHVSPGQGGTTGEPARKRGRPTKAEIERRTRMAQARGEPYPPLKRIAARKPIVGASGSVGTPSHSFGRAILPAEIKSAVKIQRPPESVNPMASGGPRITESEGGSKKENIEGATIDISVERPNDGNSEKIVQASSRTSQEPKVV